MSKIGQYIKRAGVVLLGMVAAVLMSTAPVLATSNADRNGLVDDVSTSGNIINNLRDSIEPIEYNSSYNDFDIKRFDIDMTVHTDGVYDINEKILVHFNEARHGINRRLPQHNTVRHRDDGTETENYARITNVNVDGDHFTTDTDDNGNYVLKIGDSDKTITGDHLYNIFYRYDIGRDPLPDADELYYDFIGGEWKADIYEANITIHMPKEFPTDQMAVYTGTNSSTDTDGAIYAIDGDDIYIINKQKLSQGEYLTLRLKLPDGYYVVKETAADRIADMWWIFMIVGAALTLLVVGVIWARHGRGQLVTDVVQYQPPAGLNSIEAKMVLGGAITAKETVSLLIDLANRGYLRIKYEDKRNEVLGKGLFGRNKMGEEAYTIIKLKDYDGNKDSERDFMKGLFASGSSVTKKDLEGSFYTSAGDVAKDVNESQLHESMFINNHKWQWLQIILMLVVVFLLPLPSLILRGSFTAPQGNTVWLLFLAPFVVIPMIGCLYTTVKSGAQSLGVVFATGLFAVLMAIFYIGGYFNVSTNLNDSLLYVVATAICAMVGIAISGFVVKTSRRTEQGAKLLGEVRGFKDFINTVERDRIETLIVDNPNYFYDVLPYAYALGVTKVWLNKFEGMAIRPPEWYDSPSGSVFTVNMLDNMLTSTVSGIGDSVSSDSGGGDAGGGSGGGGGDSW